MSGVRLELIQTRCREKSAWHDPLNTVAALLMQPMTKEVKKVWGSAARRSGLLKHKLWWQPGGGGESKQCLTGQWNRIKERMEEENSKSQCWERRHQIKAGSPVCNIWWFAEETAPSSGYIWDCRIHSLLPLPKLPVNYGGLRRYTWRSHSFFLINRFTWGSQCSPNVKRTGLSTSSSSTLAVQDEN